jgi:hypothetical protein
MCNIRPKKHFFPRFREKYLSEYFYENFLRESVESRFSVEKGTK